MLDVKTGEKMRRNQRKVLRRGQENAAKTKSTFYCTSESAGSTSPVMVNTLNWYLGLNSWGCTEPGGGHL